MDYSQFLKPEALILVGVIYALGIMLKKIKKIPDFLIPFILLILAILFCVTYFGLNANAIVQAVLVTATAVYTNQLYKQSTKGVKPPSSDTKDET
jgi:uncharacterized membrane protein YccC